MTEGNPDLSSRRPARGSARYILLIIVVLLVLVGLLTGCGAGLEQYPSKGPSGKVDLLLVTDSSLFGGARQLAELKDQSGMRTAVVTTARIEKEYQGADLAEKVRNCAIAFRKDRGTQSLLLVGDATRVPTRYVYCPDFHGMDPAQIDNKGVGSEEHMRKYQRYYVPTDLYFADQVDDWDINRNKVYGEAAELTGLDRDEGGFTSQMTVGRIPARNAGDLETVVGKIREYKPPVKQNALFVDATKMLGPEFDVRNLITRATSGMTGWTSTVISEGGAGSSNSEIASAFNQGNYGIIATLAHGLSFGIVIDSARRLKAFQKHDVNYGEYLNMLTLFEKLEKEPWYDSDLSPTLLDTSMVSSLKNTTPFFFMGFSCYIANPDYRPHYAFAEQLVMQEKGAIAACALTTDEMAEIKDVYEGAMNGTGGYQFQMGQSIMQNLTNGGQTFGQALAGAAQEYASGNAAKMGDPNHRRIVFGMVLIGDPTLRLVD